jgi:ferrous iron transport protein A
MKSEMLSNRVLLSALKAGSEARISSIEGEESVRHRIEEMGLREGALIRMLRSQDPQIIAIHGRRLCLRMNAFLQIWVEPDDSHSSFGKSACPK